MKAYACIEAVDELSPKIETLQHSILFAKFTLAIKQRDLDSCDQFIRGLIKHPSTPFLTATNAVRRWMDVIPDDNNRDSLAKVNEVFKLLALKYPK
jgi:hypothetical protein